MLNRAYAEPHEHHEPIEPEPPRQPETPTRQPRAPLGRRGLLWVILAAAVVLLAVFIAHHFDEYLRRTLEAKINQRLHGYHVTLGHAHLNPFGLGLTLEQTVIRQDANPEPPDIVNAVQLAASGGGLPGSNAIGGAALGTMSTLALMGTSSAIASS